MHAFDDFERGVHGLGFLDRDGAVLAYLIHRIGNDFADLRVPVGGNGRDLLDLVLVLDLLGDLVEVFHGGLDGLVDAALDANGVGAGGHILQAFAIDTLGEHRGGSGAIAGNVAGFARHFANHLRAHVFICVLQLDLLGDADTVFGDRRRPPFLVNDNIAAFRAERCGHGFRQFADAAQDRNTRGFIEHQLFCCHI